MERKKLIELIGAIFVAAIFLSSYVSLSIFNNKNNSTTTVLQNTFFASGFANSVITGYGQTMNINVQCRNSIIADNTSSFIGNTMLELESNNSISNYYAIGNKLTVQTGNLNAYQVYNYTRGKLTQTSYNCTVFSGSGRITLPQVMTMGVVTGSGTTAASVLVPNNSRTYYLPLTFTSNISTKVRVKVNTLINESGYIYGNVTVVRAPASSSTTTIKPSSTIPVNSVANEVTANTAT